MVDYRSRGKGLTRNNVLQTAQMGHLAFPVSLLGSRFKVAPHLPLALSPLSIMSTIAKQRRCYHSHLPVASDHR